ncbi:helix-turn-helix transcriptional regulator [Streptomyces sp. NPDC051976]|uniref:helix-turn-helix transcriptional regulator n=1 Tax=Streptomyces sp. NPDC051976 TaxID=3154947 RepID=UPI00342010F1
MTSGSDRYAGIVVAGTTGMGKTRFSEEVAKALPSSRRIMFLRHGGVPRQRHALPPADHIAASSLETLAAATRSARPVVVVDDAHHLDSATARTLRDVAQRRSVDLLVTVTTELDHAPAILGPRKDSHLSRVDLRALDTDATRHLATNLLGDRLLHTAASHFAALAEGNPRLLCELVHAACEQGMIVAHPEGWDVTDGVPWSPALLDILSRMLRHLNADEVRALDLIAVAEPASLPVLETLTDTGSLVGLEERHLLRVVLPPVPRTAGTTVSQCPSVRLGLRLLGHFLRERMPELKRRALLRTWIDAYEREPPVGHDDRLRVLDWRLQAALPVGVQNLLEAAQLAYHMEDLKAAARFTECAWNQQQSLDTVAAHGRSLVALGDFASADRLLDATDPEPAVQDLRSRSLLLQGRFDDARPLIATMTGVQLQHHQAMAAYFQGRFADSLRLAEPLLAHGDPVVEREAGVFVMAALCHAGRPLDALRLHRRLADDDTAPDTCRAAFHVHSLDEVHALALADCGTLDEAQQILLHPGGAAVPGRHITVDARRGLALGMVLLERGRPRQALPHLTLTSTYDTGWDLWRQRALVYRALACAALPDRAAAARVADALPALGCSYFMAHHAVALGWSATAGARRAEAADLLAEAAALHRSRGAHGDVAILVHEMTRLGLARHTSPFWDISVQGPLLQARLDYGRAVAMKDPDLLHEAAGVFAACGTDLCAAEAYAELARLYAHSGNERRATAARLRATALAARCEGAVTPALQGLKEAQPLSSRESEIAVLVAQGLTDREIAERLTISVRTVGNHLYRIYRKLGVENRRALRGLQTWH